MEFFILINLVILAYALYRLKRMEDGYSQIHNGLEARGLVKKAKK